jgi:hypothetical protein
MADNRSPLEIISEITEFNDLAEFMQDSDLDTALAAVVKLIANPHVPTVKIPGLIVQLQAISVKCGIEAEYYKTYRKGQSGSPEYIKKNVYFAARDNIDRLVDALKYMVRYN